MAKDAKTSEAVSPKAPVQREKTQAELTEEMKALEQTLPRAGEEEEKTGEDTAEGVGSKAEKAPAPSKAAPEKTETAAEETTKKLLADKYETPEDLEKAYKEAEVKITEQGQEIGELRRATETRLAKTVEKEEKLKAEEASKSFWDNPLEVIRDVVKQEIAPMSEEQRKRQIDVDIRDMQSRHEDFNEVAPAIANLIEENPLYREVKLEHLYKIVKSDAMAEKAREEGKEEAYTSMEEKKAAAAGKSTPTKGEKESSEMSIEEMEESLPKADHFIDYKGRLRKKS